MRLEAQAWFTKAAYSEGVLRIWSLKPAWCGVWSEQQMLTAVLLDMLFVPSWSAAITSIPVSLEALAKLQRYVRPTQLIERKSFFEGWRPGARQEQDVS